MANLNANSDLTGSRASGKFRIGETLIFFGVLLLFQTLHWRGMPMGLTERLWNGFDVLLYCLISAVGYCIIRSTLENRWPRFGAFFGTLSYVLLLFVFWDYVSYQWLKLHLEQSLTMFWAYAVTNFSHIKIKLTAAIMGILFSFVAAFLFRMAWDILYRRQPFRQKPIHLRKAWVMWACLIGLFYGQRWLRAEHDSPERSRTFLEALWPAVPFSDNLFSASSRSELGPLIWSPVPSDEQVDRALDTIDPSKINNARVCLIVVESLRKDITVPEIAPNLAALKTECLPISMPTANGNCTHLGWYSLFHSTYPANWSIVAHQHDSGGAIPLRFLHRADFPIHVFSNPRLEYFNFARMTFGSSLELAKEIEYPMKTLDKASPTWIGDADAKVITALINHYQSSSNRDFTIAFLDAPHHEYSWAGDYVPKFVPYLEEKIHLMDQMTPEKIEQLRNSYLNAVNFIDREIGRLISSLKESGQWENTIFIVVGDHGEEFMEDGHLIHSSALNRPQLEIAMLIRVPPRLLQKAASVGRSWELASQMDIFPSILDLLDFPADAFQLLQGHSLFGSSPPKFSLSAHCDSFTPSRYLLNKGDHKLLFRLDRPRKIAQVGSAIGLIPISNLNADYRPIEDTSVNGTIDLQDEDLDILREIFK